MSLFVASLNSGSNGNCYYIGNNEEAVLIDAGISCREIEKRMRSLGLDPAKIKALFVTHEHTDHITGIPALVKKYHLPVYITPRTYRACGFLLNEQLVHPFTAFEAMQVGGLSITAFPKWHDAIDPHSFVISHAGTTIGVFTDIGGACKNVVHYFKMCHGIFLETNYDETMLANSRYPVFLQNRISSKYGHMSNAQALQLFLDHRPAFMTHVFLSHLSKENNCPEMVSALFNNISNGVEIVHASRYEATGLYHINAANAAQMPAASFRLPIPIAGIAAIARKRKSAAAEMQLRLF